MASYLEQLIKAQAESYGSGTTTDPFTGGFILPDGRFLNMGMYGTRGDDHRVITWVLPRSSKIDTAWDGLVHVARKANLVRWQPENWSLSIFTKPTAQQLATIQHLIDWKRMANERGDGYTLVEIFPKTGKPWASRFDPAFGDYAVERIVDFFRKTKDNPPGFQELTARFIQEAGYGANLSDDGSVVTVYHGTSPGAVTKINKSGVIRNYPFFALDRATANRFGYAAITRGKPKIMQMRVATGDLLPTGGYLSANAQRLYKNKDGVWRSTKDNPPRKKRKPIRAPEELPTFKHRDRWGPLQKHMRLGRDKGLSITTSIGKYHIRQMGHGYWEGFFEPRRKRGVRIGPYERLVIRDKDGIHEVFRTMGDVRKAAILHYNWYVRY